LFWEVVRRGEETEFSVPPDELVVNLHQRMVGLPLQDRVEFVDLFRAIKRQAYEEGMQLEAEAVQAEGFIKLIKRAQELERRAGRSIKQDMTLGEALARLEEAEDQ
ncbi:MAG TPA: hypothetical protein VKA82_22700, partial [Rubrobacter sp.]|nr:hypothetical protein [Rubrobacter sp.]